MGLLGRGLLLARAASGRDAIQSHTSQIRKTCHIPDLSGIRAHQHRISSSQELLPSTWKHTLKE